MRRVVVIGGGIAGLTVAYHLRHAASVTLVEERERLGGVIVTERAEGFLVEGGPDSFLVTKPAALDLCRELGLENELIAPKSRTVHVLSGGRLRPLPEGVFLTVPTRVWPLLTSSLISLPGKLRMALDLVLPRGPEVHDESLGGFVRRRLGAEALEKLAEPIMAGIYMADADRLSLRATFPRFADMEREHRSLIRALRRAPPSGHLSPFLSLRAGMHEIVTALVSQMPDVTIRTRAPVRRIEPAPSSVEGPGYRIHLDDGTIEADGVVLATGPGAAASLARPFAPALAEAIGRIPVVGSVTVSLGYRGARLPDGTGFVIPRRERRRIVACTFSSQKFDGRAPEGHALLRCFLAEGPADPVAAAREDLRAILGIADEPVVTRVFRWPGANPIYEVGHLARVREIDSLAPPGLFLTGSAYRGIGIPDCVRDAAQTAQRVHVSLP